MWLKKTITCCVCAEERFKDKMTLKEGENIVFLTAKDWELKNMKRGGKFNDSIIEKFIH